MPIELIGVEGPVGDLAVVLQSDLDAVAEPELGHPFGGQVVLLARQRHTHHAGAVVERTVHGHPPPPAPHVEQAHPRSETQLAAHELVLVGLGRGEIVVGGLEHGARVGHRRAEDDLVERVGDVVVVADRGTVTAL